MTYVNYLFKRKIDYSNNTYYINIIITTNDIKICKICYLLSILN